jgi:hypothetical protein
MTYGGDGVIGFKFSEVQKEHLSLSHTGYSMPASQRLAISAAHLGKKLSVTHRKNIAKATSKTWIVVFPGGTERRIVNLKEFCHSYE